MVWICVSHWRNGSEHLKAEVSALENDYLFAFSGGLDQHLTAVLDGNDILFSNNILWRRSGAL